MRRFLFGVVIASVTAAMPAWAFGGDREIAKSVMSELQEHKAAGNLKGFDIDLKVEEGIIYLTGEVASRAQRALVLNAAANAAGSENIVNELSVKGETKPAAAPKEVEVERAASQAEQIVQPASSTDEATPSANDMKVTDAVISKLGQAKSAGNLRGFELDVSTVSGDVWVKGSVASQTQKDLVLDIARRTSGVARVIDDITVVGGQVRQVSTGVTPAPVPQGASMPIASMPIANVPSAPRAFAPSGLASMTMSGEYAGGGAPKPMQMGGAEYGAGAPRYDQPNMPSYAWPSYAAYPNYAAVTYPKQYSPSAWPYIGPFYPYPQVPLGWRKVSLEWDDGLWYLDFTSK
jgi:osmotically-inducible protein OsmY